MPKGESNSVVVVLASFLFISSFGIGKGSKMEKAKHVASAIEQCKWVKFKSFGI